MEREQQIDRIIQRTRRYWYEDGLTEIATGVIFLLVGAVLALEAVATPGSPLEGLAAFGIVVVVIGGIWGARWAVQRLKERYVYPRTGRVVYPRRKSATRAIVAGVLAMVTSAVTAGLIASSRFDEALLPFFQGLVIGAVFLYWGQALGLWRFFVVAAISVAIGLAVVLSGLEGNPAAAVCFTGTGLALAASGGYALASYFRHTQPLEEE